MTNNNNVTCFRHAQGTSNKHDRRKKSREKKSFTDKNLLYFIDRYYATACIFCFCFCYLVYTCCQRNVTPHRSHSAQNLRCTSCSNSGTKNNTKINTFNMQVDNRTDRDKKKKYATNTLHYVSPYRAANKREASIPMTSRQPANTYLKSPSNRYIFVYNTL